VLGDSVEWDDLTLFQPQVSWRGVSEQNIVGSPVVRVFRNFHEADPAECFGDLPAGRVFGGEFLLADRNSW
jgi:hypothetical protein